MWDKCVDEGLCIIDRNTIMKHVKSVGTLVGACVLFTSKQWCWHNIARSIKENNKNVEMQIEHVHQQEYTGRALVLCTTMNKEEDVSTKIINELNENELGIKFVSFKRASAKGMMNSIRMNYCDKENLRFEVLKGISVNNALECECELTIVKEALHDEDVNQRKIFVGIEQET